MQTEPTPPDLRPGDLVLVDGTRLARFDRRIDKRRNPDPNGEILVLRGGDGVEYARLPGQVSRFDRDEVCTLATGLQSWGEFLEERPHRISRVFLTAKPYAPILGDGGDAGGARTGEPPGLELRLEERPPAVRVRTVVEHAEHPCRGFLVEFDVLVAWRPVYDLAEVAPLELRTPALWLWASVPGEVADLDWSRELEAVRAELAACDRSRLERTLGKRPDWHAAAAAIHPEPEGLTGRQSAPNRIRARALWELAEKAAGGGL